MLRSRTRPRDASPLLRAVACAQFLQAQKKRPEGRFFCSFREFKGSEANMAQRTGLEPATPGVTGRYSNRLNYRCVSLGLASV